MLKQKLQAFLNLLDDAEMASKISKKCDISETEAKSELKKYKNETFFALRVVGEYLNLDDRIIEVGAGAGLFSYFLKYEGYNIVALEPVGIGYDFMKGAFEAVRDQFPDLKLEHLNIGAEALDPSTHGKFDFVFSIHVLEHLPDFPDGMNAMESILAENGQMVHVCPNYYFPYDPHFGIPLLPVFPKITSFLLPKRIRDSGKWKSINFINFGQIKRHANKIGLLLNLKPSLFSEMIQRVEDDEEFAARHGSGISGLIINILKKTRLIKLVGLYPTKLSSPIIFELNRENNS